MKKLFLPCASASLPTSRENHQPGTNSAKAACASTPATTATSSQNRCFFMSRPRA